MGARPAQDCCACGVFFSSFVFFFVFFFVLIFFDVLWCMYVPVYCRVLIPLSLSLVVPEKHLVALLMAANGVRHQQTDSTRVYTGPPTQENERETLSNL